MNKEDPLGGCKERPDFTNMHVSRQEGEPDGFAARTHEGGMGRSLLLIVISSVVLLAGHVGTAGSDPLKNFRLLIPATCNDGERFEFVINGEGIAGHIIGDTGNIHPVQDTVTYTYTDPTTGEPVTTTVVDSLGRGKKEGLQGDLKRCEGTVKYTDPELGLEVTAEFDVVAYFTPRR